jgi:hypothetical protein
VLRLGDRHALYYAGVSAAEAGSFACLCGLAYLDDALCTATRALTGPLLERDEADPHSGGVVCVSPQPARETLHMWYESRVSSPGPLPRFAIKHSVSRDGIAWNRLDEVSIGDDGERSYVSNPSVLIDETGFRMWYSYKVGERYRIGYAESDDGRTWKRSDDSAGIAPSSIGWDSDDVEYPSVFTHGRDLYMLYNGNEYGRTGFGMARLARS